MSDPLFDNNLREKLFSFSDPQDTPDWEDLCARMTRKRAAVRRRRIILYSSAAAACMLLLFGLFMLYAPEEANHVPTVAVVPPATLQEAQPSIEEILPQDTPVLLAADRPSLPVGPAPQASAGPLPNRNPPHRKIWLLLFRPMKRLKRCWNCL